MHATRVVIGAGLFGCYAALVLAERGHQVLLVDQESEPLFRASFVNQARLHTGLHYPRSLLTAREALQYYHRFREAFEPAVRDFTQIYAVAAHNSKVSGGEFAAFIERLGQPVQEVDADRWFRAGSVQRAFEVEEPAFDAAILRQILHQRLTEHPGIDLRLGTPVVGGRVSDGEVGVELGTGEVLHTEGVVIAAYAGTNAVRRAFGLSTLPIAFELAEVLLGRVSPALEGMGFTVMDGPFWSLMPFGRTGQVSLTSVGLTPLQRATEQPVFTCQDRRPDCTPLQLQDCTSCPVRPPSSADHQVRQMGLFLKNADAFSPVGSLLTVKAILTSTEVDDARPTMVSKEPDADVWTVLSGKVSTLFDLDRSLS
jgi:2-polyprenyl-6-methoxyphenol hydroxylase-like FAD-dependent oxidoreductase